MSKNMILFSLLALLLVGGCTARPTQTTGDNPALQPVEQADGVALFVGGNHEGVSASLSDTSGPVTVTVGKSYISALGTPCKRAQLRGASGVTRSAFCEQGGVWRKVPDIFASGE